MGLFFFISAYFTHLAFQRKGFWKFTKDRLIRLGIPLLLTLFGISVLTSYMTWPLRSPKFTDYSFVDIWKTGRAFGPGVMWFVVALCYFTIFYYVARVVFKELRKKVDQKPLRINTVQILSAAITLGILCFVVRIKYPLFTGAGTKWLPFVLGHFPQYIFLFAFGVGVAHYRSEIKISSKQIRFWGRFSLLLILVIFPLIFFIGKVHHSGVRLFLGNGTWHSLAYAMWEQLTGISIMVSLMGLFKAKWNMQNNLLKKLSDASYAAYVLHPPVLVGISILFMDWKTILLFKFLAVTPIAVVVSFGVALLVKQIPILKRIF